MSVIKDTPVLNSLFWTAYGLGCLLGLVYLGFFVAGVVEMVREPNLLATLALLPGPAALGAQVYTMRTAARLYHLETTRPSRLFLILVGGSVLVAFVWMGACVIAVPASGMRFFG